MVRFISKANHLAVFLTGIFGYFGVMIGIAFLAMVIGRSPVFVASALSITILPVMMIVFYLWVYSIASTSYWAGRKKQEKPGDDSKLLYFLGLMMWLSVLGMTAFMVSSVLTTRDMFEALQNAGLASSDGRSISRVAQPVFIIFGTPFSLLTIIGSSFVAARSMLIYETDSRSIGTVIGYTLAIISPPIGVWLMQPKLNVMVEFLERTNEDDIWVD